jgi:hypothetical protein
MCRCVVLVRTDVSEEWIAGRLLTRTTRWHIPEDDLLHSPRHENPKPYMAVFECGTLPVTLKKRQTLRAFGNLVVSGIWWLRREEVESHSAVSRTVQWVAQCSESRSAVSRTVQWVAQFSESHSAVSRAVWSCRSWVLHKMLFHEATQLGARGSVVVEWLCYRPGGHGFETSWDHSIYSIALVLSATLGPGVYSAANRNEY